MSGKKNSDIEADVRRRRIHSYPDAPDPTPPSPHSSPPLLPPLLSPPPQFPTGGFWFGPNVRVLFWGNRGLGLLDVLLGECQLSALIDCNWCVEFNETSGIHGFSWKTPRTPAHLSRVQFLKHPFPKGPSAAFRRQERVIKCPKFRRSILGAQDEASKWMKHWGYHLLDFTGDDVPFQSWHFLGDLFHPPGFRSLISGGLDRRIGGGKWDTRNQQTAKPGCCQSTPPSGKLKVDFPVR